MMMKKKKKRKKKKKIIRDKMSQTLLSLSLPPEKEDNLHKTVTMNYIMYRFSNVNKVTAFDFQIW